MSGYGFRLYTVKLVAGVKKSKAIDLAQCGMSGDEHASVWIRRLLSLLESHGPLTGPPINVMAIDETEQDLAPISSYVRRPNRGEYRTRFLDHTTSPAGRILFRFQYARTGKVTVGIDDEQTIPLGHIPTGDSYRALLYLPASGPKGVLALESIPSAPNPSRMINNWLARAALDVVLEDQEVAAKAKPEAKLKPQAFKLNFNQYPNIDRIQKAVENDTTAKVVLKRDKIDGEGRPVDDAMVLSSTLRSQNKRTTAGKLAGTMVRRFVGGLGDDEEPVSIDDLESLIDGSLDGIEWTEGYIQVDDETGLKKIGLDHIDKFFIYPVGSNVAPTDKKFEQAVAKEVVGLQSVLGVDLDLS